MWKTVRLILCLIFFVPAFALLGAFASLDAGERGAWAGLIAGAIVGLFFGLGFGGFRARWFAALFGPAGPNKDGE
jgi:RsiW-degrading membrane proteinase PrsW (M82 family)